MPRIIDINEAESIRTGRLSIKRNWIYYFTRLPGLGLSAFAFYFGVMIEWAIRPREVLYGFFTYILCPILILGAAYFIYRILTENKLMIIKTGYSKDQNEKIIRDFLHKHKYPLTKHRENIIISEINDSMWESFSYIESKTDYIFIVDDLLIYCNAKKISGFLILPTWFDHLLLKKDLNKFISKPPELHPGS